MHVDTDIFDGQEFSGRLERLEIEVEIVFLSGGQNIDDLITVEIIEDAGVLGFEITVLGIDLINAQHFGKSGRLDVTVFVEEPYSCCRGDAG